MNPSTGPDRIWLFIPYDSMLVYTTPPIQHRVTQLIVHPQRLHISLVGSETLKTYGIYQWKDALPARNFGWLGPCIWWGDCLSPSLRSRRHESIDLVPHPFPQARVFTSVCVVSRLLQLQCLFLFFSFLLQHTSVVDSRYGVSETLVSSHFRAVDLSSNDKELMMPAFQTSVCCRPRLGGTC